MRLISLPAAAALDRLLNAEPWAREKLAPFAGETVEFSAPLTPALRLAIGDGGCIVPSDAAPTLIFSLRAGALAALVASPPGEDPLMRAFDVSGNTRLASEILLLARHLRWDAEEDLSRLVGDVLAHRIGSAVRAFAEWHRDAARRLAENVVEYAVEERRWLIPRREFDDYAAGVAQFRDRIARLAKRLDLAGAVSSGH